MIFIFTIPWSHQPLNSTTSQQPFTNRNVGKHSDVFNCLHSAIRSALCMFLLRKVLPRFTQLFVGIQLGLLSRITYRCNTRPAKSLISLWVRKFGIGVGQQQSNLRYTESLFCTEVRIPKHCSQVDAIDICVRYNWALYCTQNLKHRWFCYVIFRLVQNCPFGAW